MVATGGHGIQRLEDRFGDVDDVTRLKLEVGRLALTNRAHGYLETQLAALEDAGDERTVLIGELAKAAAKKVLVTGEDISLPAMNSYERRLVHLALAIHPDVKTESAGEARDRHVIIKKIAE